MLWILFACHAWFYHEGDNPGDCSDGKDNDRDEAIDCKDMDCEYDKACSPQIEDTADTPSQNDTESGQPDDDTLDTGVTDTGPASPDTGEWPDGDWVVLASGGWHNCAVNQARETHCWGRNIEGQLDAPSNVSFRAFALGNHFSCGLGFDSRIDCWGDWEVDNPPVFFKKIVAGVDFVCGIDFNQAIQCWGKEGTEDLWTVPQGSYQDIDAGAKHVCALNEDGVALCWGDDTYDQLNAGGGNFTAIGAGFAHSCGIDTDRRAKCWGTNADGATEVPPVLANSLVVGLYHSCITNPNNQGICWGGESYGLSGGLIGNTFQYLSAGNLHTCGLTESGAIACYGDNTQGQIDAPE